MKEQALQILRQIADSHSKALRMLTHTVDYTRDEVVGEALACLSEGKEVFLMGVKNTSAISQDYVQALHKNGFLFHTLDNTNEKGRAIYTDLRNPLTGRPMTGSSATTAIHVLKNINQIGIGTDGGGSVLAPALSCGLYAIMAKGMEIVGEGRRTSTDGIGFTPGIGILGQRYEECMKAVLCLCEEQKDGEKEILREKADRSENQAFQKIGVMVWEKEKNCQIDRLRKLLPNINFREYVIRRTSNRQELIELFQEATKLTPIVISSEGPIDIEGLGDSILGGFGERGSRIQEVGGKHFVKIANLVDATAVAIPNGELASGYLILARKGMDFGRAAIQIGLELQRKIQRPKVFEEYFFRQNEAKGFI